jgi:hypothetical protein
MAKKWAEFGGDLDQMGHDHPAGVESEGVDGEVMDAAQRAYAHRRHPQAVRRAALAVGPVSIG